MKYKMMVVAAFLSAAGLGICVASKPAPKPPDTRDLITSVDIQKQTIVVTHQEKHIAITYLVTDRTTIEINDQNATIKEVKPGMEVRGIRLGSGEDTPQILEDLDLKTGGH